MPSPLAHRYVLMNFGNTPRVVGRLLAGVEGAVWDARPEADRFTLREIVAHLADWDTVWHGRITSIISEDMPHLSRENPDQRAQEAGYADSDPAERLAHFAEHRAQLVTLLEDLSVEDWDRVGVFPDPLGRLTLFETIAVALGHDGYHVQQILDYQQ